MILADILSTLLLIYFITQTPMVDFWSNAIQIFNELVVLTCVWLMFVFTNYVPSPETRYDLAFFFLYLIAADMILNVLYLILTIVKKIYSACRSFITKRNAKKVLEMSVQPKGAEKIQELVTPPIRVNLT